MAFDWGLVQDGTSPRKVASDLRLPESQDSMAKKFKVMLKEKQFKAIIFHNEINS